MHTRDLARMCVVCGAAVSVGADIDTVVRAAVESICTFILQPCAASLPAVRPHYLPT